MAHHQGRGGFDPRYDGRYGNGGQVPNNQYPAYYDPRYQQQPYSYATQNVQVQIPTTGYPYNGMQAHHSVPPQSPAFSHQSPALHHQTQGINQTNYNVNQQYYPQQSYQNQHLQGVQYSSPQTQQVQLPPRLQQHSPPLRAPPHSPPTQQTSRGTPLAHTNGYTPSPKPSRPPPPPPTPPQNTPPIRSAPVPTPVLPPPLDIDYASLTMDLADRFLSEAYHGSSGQGRQSDPQVFARLISSGLACMDLVLGKYKSNLQPSSEAAIRLRYASILCAETQNHMDAEEMLSRGISLCDRYHFTSYKYNMQHLLARATYSKNPKAAARYADGLIRDVEAVQQIPWLYAMRILRVALALQISTSQEILVGTSQLRLVSSMATSKKDLSVAAVAHAVEALFHLKHSGGNDGIEQAQRALAGSRSLQLDSATKAIHQLTVMNLFVDLICSLLQNNPVEAGPKMVEMNKFLDEHSNEKTFTASGEFLVPLQGSIASGSETGALAGGIVDLDSAGQVSLRMKWLPKDEIYALGYVLSASATAHKNAQDGQKAEAFLKEAHSLLNRSKRKPDASAANAWQTSLTCHVHAQTVFALSARSTWDAANKELKKLKAAVDTLHPSAQGIFPVFIAFLEATILQGTGQTSEALKLYSQPPLSLYTTDLTHAPPAHNDLALLSALNTLLIVCVPSHPEHSRTPTLLATLEPIATEHPSRDIQAAYHLIHAVALNASTSTSELSPESAGMLKTKQYLQTALQLAKRTSNNQLCCITLNFMSFKYFRGVVGAQAQKSASSACALAKKGQDPLWTSVAHGLLAETLETQGKGDEADKVRGEGLEDAQQLPEQMWRRAEELGL